MLLCCRNLNGNSLSGRVPAALGGRLLHGTSFKYVAISGALKYLLALNGIHAITCL